MRQDILLEILFTGRHASTDAYQLMNKISSKICRLLTSSSYY